MHRFFSRKHVATTSAPVRLADYAHKMNLLYSEAYHLYTSGQIDGSYRDGERRVFVPGDTVERDGKIVERGAAHGLRSYTALTNLRWLMVEQLADEVAA